MSDYIVDGAALTATANAIRAKTGDSGGIPFDASDGFADAISQISGGSSSSSADSISFTGKYFPTDVFTGTPVCYIDASSNTLYICGKINTDTPLVMMGLVVPVDRYFGTPSGSIYDREYFVNGTRYYASYDNDSGYELPNAGMGDDCYVFIKCTVAGGGLYF